MSAAESRRSVDRLRGKHLALAADHRWPSNHAHYMPEPCAEILTEWLYPLAEDYLALAAERDECADALKAVCEMAEELRTALSDEEGAWEAEYDGWLVMQRHFRLLPDVDLWDSQELLAAIDGRLLAIGERTAAIRAALSSEDATRPTPISDSASTCLKCGNRSVVAHGGGFRCRDCGKDEMRPTGDKQ